MTEAGWLVRRTAEEVRKALAQATHAEKARVLRTMVEALERDPAVPWALAELEPELQALCHVAQWLTDLEEPCRTLETWMEGLEAGGTLHYLMAVCRGVLSAIELCDAGQLTLGPKGALSVGS